MISQESKCEGPSTNKGALQNLALLVFDLLSEVLFRGNLRLNTCERLSLLLVILGKLPSLLGFISVTCKVRELQ